jgi:hypothetical protein
MQAHLALLFRKVERSPLCELWQKPICLQLLLTENLASKPSFCTIRAYLRDARRESSSDFAPVTTILPEAKMSAVVLGSRIRMITAAKR